jgi:superoxide dismutase, Fe-Mn family
MTFALPELPYSSDALAPHISAETLSFHHGKHHQAYVNNLNKFVDADPSLQGKSLEQLILSTSGGVFNNAAQVWNHTFYWHSLSPSGGGAPTGRVAELIDAKWGSFDGFKTAFAAAAAGQFGSGWAWLVQKSDGSLDITTSGNAENPMTAGHTPVLTCDVWEHAYYVDYRNDRGAYVKAWWNLVNWDFANANLS